ncbi:hypothetical protein ACFUC1_15070 [Pedococcus sp. NPDC057267]|uniref:hypothetical protein n=1 Tax=Pedococcus sp. NPDC057267 TaxID=3346077 RepID=UPI0036319563
MRHLGRFLAAAGLVVAGGLALPGGAAQAAACSGTTGVTVVIDYGSSSSTLCGPDASSAIRVLTSVASVTYPPQYPGTVVCQINDVPSQPCTRMPPSSAYWAFFHATRGGSWVYSSSGVAEYDPPPGSVIGFAFGSGGAPSSPPPAAAPKPSPTPSPSSTSSTPRSTGTSSTPGSTGSSSRPSSPTTVLPNGSTATVSATARTQAPTASRPSTATTTSSASATTTTTAPPASGSTEQTAAATAGEPTSGSGSPATLLAGVGLVTLVGAAAAYLALRRRAQQH